MAYLTKSDMFSFDKKHFNLEKLQRGRVGTTLGNADFLAEQSGIPRSKFIEIATLSQLVSLLLKDRIDVLVFERISVMSLLQAQTDRDIYYQTIGDVPASIAVSNDNEGDELKEKLDQLIMQLNQDKIFADYLKYSRMPDSGTVPRK